MWSVGCNSEMIRRKDREIMQSWSLILPSRSVCCPTTSSPRQGSKLFSWVTYSTSHYSSPSTDVRAWRMTANKGHRNNVRLAGTSSVQTKEMCTVRSYTHSHGFFMLISSPSYTTTAVPRLCCPLTQSFHCWNGLQGASYGVRNFFHLESSFKSSWTVAVMIIKSKGHFNWKNACHIFKSIMQNLPWEAYSCTTDREISLLLRNPFTTARHGTLALS